MNQRDYDDQEALDTVDFGCLSLDLHLWKNIVNDVLRSLKSTTTCQRLSTSQGLARVRRLINKMEAHQSAHYQIQQWEVARDGTHPSVATAARHRQRARYTAG
ncbi:unnamed protein product, partial [Ectocarpus sp. 13 AM-2016]